MDRKLDAKSLRGLAHPLRVQLLGLLRSDGPATATQLAARVGESSGTTSWHLRQLAEHGFVEEDAERGNRRERWWRAVHEHTVVTTGDFGPDEQGPLASYLYEVASAHYRQSTAFLAERHQWSAEWTGAASLSDTLLSLRPDELGELTRRLHELLAEYRRPPEDGDEQVVVQFQAFPRSKP
ncbi:helix-turn-helix transcriptional regulator [Saccharopolyspora hirsuta]|uniref:Helix-turn-helix transcriptional regulator n=1 Tax=Saccharopolyspora hirsuta TaxID=1837 RepID=A0A5M7BSG0_SACHI|nr:winged helix-turn-helix domain-containing protein [Saccharopolyspora hirsuta]KAA5832060.1 helix-turn-helix transcriptional regulator [Saccharopolyspora hirsuta]